MLRKFLRFLIIFLIFCFTINIIVHIKSFFIKFRPIGTSYIWNKIDEKNWENDIVFMKRLGFDTIRVSAYWNLIEEKEGVFKFEKFDNLINLLKKYDFKIIITTGPIRFLDYPEFYLPRWIKVSNKEFFNDVYAQEKGLNFVKKVIQRYKNIENIIGWQFDNEPTLQFWGYKGMPYKYLKKGVSLIKKIDKKRPIIITHFCGDLHSNPIRTSLYTKIAAPHVYLKIFGRNYYPLPIISMWVANTIALFEWKPVWITEFQAEDWDTDFTPFNLQYLFYVCWYEGLDGILFWEYRGWTYEKHSADLIPVIQNLIKVWTFNKEFYEIGFIVFDLLLITLLLPLLKNK